MGNLRSPVSRVLGGMLAVLLVPILGYVCLGQTTTARSIKTDAKAETKDALDKKIITAAKQSQIMPNLTYLSDVIGPRLTGSKALDRAGKWAMAKMKENGLENVHLEPWLMPEGWERGYAKARLLEPRNGVLLALASMAWTGGTDGKITGNIVVLNAKKPEDLNAYKGKLKGAIILDGAPTKLTPIAEIEKPGGFRPTNPIGKKGNRPSFEEMMALRREKNAFLKNEGVAAILMDAGKHHNLLFTTGSWPKDGRASAVNTIPTAYVSHDHYALLHRLASRPAPAKTLLELEIKNKFIPGPLAVNNVVGEIRGSEKPEEFVVIGAHLDSWDLGQGSLDNGTGTSVVLETARLLANCGTRPKRTIRFVLFTGEEQGLHGSKAYVEKHKDELERTSACIVHDTGTGKVLGIGWLGRPNLKEILESELSSLKSLGVDEPYGRGFGGSDHASFDKAGVPGGAFRQEIAGYRFAHHSQADTLIMAREEDLIQGAQVMAVTAMWLANRDELLPRIKK